MIINALYRHQAPEDWINAPVRVMRVGVVDHDFDDVVKPTCFDLDSLRRSLAYWRLTPVTIGHPAEFITNGADPSIIGALEDARIENHEYLAATAWMYRPQLQQHPDLLRRIEAGEPIETSGAYFANTTPLVGTFRGERFSRVARSLVANHLALLPATVGAFGLRRGCGMNAPEQAAATGIVVNSATIRGKAQANPLRLARQRRRIEPSPVPAPTPTSQL